MKRTNSFEQQKLKMGKEEGESQFGFKNKEKADETIKLLAEHDLQYQKLTVRGLLGRAKRVLQSKCFSNWKTCFQSFLP